MWPGGNQHLLMPPHSLDADRTAVLLARCTTDRRLRAASTRQRTCSLARTSDETH
jgi:hypothetical protein